MIEKLGHTKRIQTMRREWINEEKQKVFETSDSSRNVPETRDLPTRVSADQFDPATREHQDPSTLHMAAPQKSGSADQDLFMPGPEGADPPPTSHPEPDDDDLEDLLREHDENEQAETRSSMPQMLNSVHDDFDAEYEAMNDMGM